LIFSAFRHRNNAFWGNKLYAAHENSLFGSLNFQKTIGAHSIASGISFVNDQLDESFNDANYQQHERVPGAYIKYTWKGYDKITAMAGFRYDHHNLYGNFYTPRFHVKYLWTPSTTIRLSVGKGYRSSRIFTENLVILASSKQLTIFEPPKVEQAWNYGIQFSKDISLGDHRPVTLIVDFFRTTFQNRVIVDSEQKAEKIYIYNLKGRAFSNSFQLEMNATLFSGMEAILAWR